MTLSGRAGYADEASVIYLSSTEGGKVELFAVWKLRRSKFLLSAGRTTQFEPNRRSAGTSGRA
jgi:hypothetical protein